MEQKNIIHILHYLQAFNFKNCQTLITDSIKKSNIDLIKVEKDYMLKSLFNEVDRLLTIKEDGSFTDIDMDLIIIPKSDLIKILELI